jgi:hypothetical protein
MKVLLVTPWDTPCGIAEHSYYLQQAVEAADPGIEVLPHPAGLDPEVVVARETWITERDDLIHLNYHAALHSRWTPDYIRQLQGRGYKVVVTFHDTGVPNSDLCKAICAAADAVVVHEPFDDLPAEKVHYWRMGVPAAEPAYSVHPFMGWVGQPVLGSIGFPFPWKHYDQLAKITAQAGWALLLIAPNTTPEQQVRWHELNPHIRVIPEFVPRGEAISLLACCDATAFIYVCHNTGQSAALLQGIAARKPVFALSTCRQFRALFYDPLGCEVIRWCDTFEEVANHLLRCPIQRVDPGIVALAQQDSWAGLGRRYAALYRRLV